MENIIGSYAELVRIATWYHHGGSIVVKWSRDGGRTWDYGVLDRRPSRFERGEGLGVDREVSPGGAHRRAALFPEDFERGVVVCRATEEEVSGRRFSYDDRHHRPAR